MTELLVVDDPSITERAKDSKRSDEDSYTEIRDRQRSQVDFVDITNGFCPDNDKENESVEADDETCEEHCHQTLCMKLHHPGNVSLHQDTKVILKNNNTKN